MSEEKKFNKDAAIEMLDVVRRGIDAYESILTKALSSSLKSLAEDDKYRSMLGVMSKTGEASVVQQLIHFIRHPSDTVPMGEIPMSDHDTINLEFSVKVGRADMVIFHVDGSASVIEVKDGGAGLRCVMAGIGQACMYACQIGNAPGSIQSIRRVLAWSSMSQEEDALVSKACRLAGVIPVKLFNTVKLKEAINCEASRMADARVDRLFEKEGICSGFTDRFASFVDALGDVVNGKSNGN